MIDPEKKTSWALELRRKIQGAPPVRGWREDEWIARDYSERRESLENEGHAAPDKEALSQVATKRGLTVETIRQIVKRDRKRQFNNSGQKSDDF
jgi:hypothetical protein